jgi:hypothetical protein
VSRGGVLLLFSTIHTTLKSQVFNFSSTIIVCTQFHDLFVWSSCYSTSLVIIIQSLAYFYFTVHSIGITNPVTENVTLFQMNDHTDI